MQSPNITGIQKVLIALFVLTIVSSCVSLVIFTIEKPDKTTVKCERSGSGSWYSAKPLSLDAGSIDQISSQQIQQNCTTKTNPPMSPFHSAITDIATYSAVIFLIVSAYVYATRKKETPPEPPQHQ